MRVFKFGGASVKDAESVKNVVSILRENLQEPLIVVLSAMGKTTNAFEELASFAFRGEILQRNQKLEQILSYHQKILEELFKNHENRAFEVLENRLEEIRKIIIENPPEHYDTFYDQLVPYGELLSTAIVSAYLNHTGLTHALLDARQLISTDNTYRDAKIRWPETVAQIKYGIGQVFQNQSENNHFVLTQGFIGSNPNDHSTTLGREGSDFSAAIFAYALDAREVVIWKDVPGLLNADPKIFPEAVRVEKISYADAIELAYYGAKIIHPKTIKPLQNKNIPLIVKSFADPSLPGSLICEPDGKYDTVPSYIIKFNQILVSITPRDFSFINEENLTDIFATFTEFRIPINLMQNSAISFSVCVDGDKPGFEPLMEALMVSYKVKYNRKLELITIRNYNQACVDMVVGKRSVLLEQRSRATIQLVVKAAQ